MITAIIKARIYRIKFLFWSGVASLKSEGIIYTFRHARAIIEASRQLRYWINEELFTEEELEAQRNEDKGDLRFSIVVPLCNPDKDYLREMVESVLKQTHSNWELCLADGSDKRRTAIEAICRGYADADSRIKYKRLNKNEGISDIANEAMSMADGDYISLLDQSDILHPAALHEMAQAAMEGADFIYTDEAIFESPDIKKITVINYKPDFGPDSINGNNYIGHLTSFKRDLLEVTGVFRSEYDGSQEHELFLRLIDAASHIAHIPEVLYYRRNHSDSTARSILNKTKAIAAGARAVEDNLRAKGIDASVEPNGKYGFFYRVRYPITGKPKISIIIPNYEHIDDLRTCVGSVIEKSTYDNYEIIIVENNSKSEKIFEYYDEISSEHENIKIIKWEGEFNYAAINNYAVREAVDGEYLILLNNDTEVITPKWMEELLMYVQRKDVGAAGAKLYYPDETIQHAGVIIGLGSVAGHISLRAPRFDAGYMGRNIYAQDLSAVTGACVMIRRDVWDEVGGLDEAFAVAYNDVDLCLKIREAGYLIVWTPFAELYHYEFKSRGPNVTYRQHKTHIREIWTLMQKWDSFLEKGDPYYNPNLSLERPDYTPKAHLDHAK